MRDNIEKNLEWIRENERRFTTNFDLRQSRSKSNEMDIRKAVDLLNMILGKWGYSKIKKEKQIRKRVNGKLFDVSDFNNENTEDIDVYENMKSRKVRSVTIEREKKM